MRFCMIGMLMVILRCSDNGSHSNVADIKVDSYVHASIELIEHRIERMMRWVNHEQVYRDVICESNLVEVSNSFLTNTIPRINCVIPLFVKFEKSKHDKPYKDYGGLRDLRENKDGQYVIEALVIGKREDLLDNRLYFIFNQGNVTTTWVRRFDNILAGMGCSPQVHLVAGCAEGIGVFEIRWSAIAPIFIGEEKYGIEYFLQQIMSGSTTLCWGSGKWGLYEGKHVYETDRFVKWFNTFRDSLILLKVIFATHDTYILSIDDASTGGYKRRWN